MKKFKKYAYILLIVTIIILSFMVYSSTTSNSSSDVQEKTFSEIRFLESKLTYMFNSLNNIEFENYKISTEDISEKSKQSSKNSSSAGNGGDSQGESKQEDGSGSSSSSEDSSSTSENNTSQNETKKYSLNMKGILTSKDEINWEYIKNEAEILQNSISIIILDLYETGLNNNDVLNFNKEFDNLLIQIKNEDKENTLKQLSILYSYIPKFLKYCNTNEEYEVVINAKLNIFNAYAILDSEDWNTMNQYVLAANKEFSKLLTDIKYKNKNQNTVNKCYITINGLQNAVEIKDREIFLIKYRNLLEDLNNI